jgi:carbamate kinase
MRVVIALGGNALLRRGEPLDAGVQRVNVARAAEAVAEVAAEHEVVLTHGNGPQVGLLALQNAATREAGAFPLDVLDAQTEGMIGYALDRELSARLGGGRVAALLTQVVVRSDDPAWTRPTKPIGPVYPADQTDVLAARGWQVTPDAGGVRRVVASPEPREILELAVVRLLIDHEVTVVCAGGGGIPVVADGHGGWRGAEAVVDKDRTSLLLATGLQAGMLVLLTDVPGVQQGWGTPGARTLRVTTPTTLRTLSLDAGSMGPKAEAACRFVEETGRAAAIGALEDVAALVEGRTGTLVVPDGTPGAV